jgi:diaminohydroxyphosphoribosylaminopyrimidine deaminase/5-amino-6-(5-phosphoribosylamino)uracil reductase
MGLREVPPDRRVLDGSADTVRLETRDPRQALAELADRGCRHVLLEGGPTLAAAFLTAGVVDEVVAYVAPLLLGAGRRAVAGLGITTIADALHLDVTEVTTVGAGRDANARLTLIPADGRSR